MKFLLLALFICFVSANVPSFVKPHNKLPAGVKVINSINASYPSNNDLSSFDSLARRAEVFAIGECSHGVAGYQNFQFRLSKYLIINHGYRRILHELVSDDRALNEYLLTGEGDLQMILYLNPWQNSDVEMFNFFQWVREYNSVHPKDPVTVHTVDPQSPWLNLPFVEKFLQLYDAEYNQTFSSSLYPLIRDNCFGATADNQIDWAYSPETDAYYQCGCLPDNKTNACVSSITYLEDVLEAEAKDLFKQFGYTFVGDVKYALRSLRSWQTKSALLYTSQARQSIRFREVAFGLNVLWQAKRDNKRGREKSILIAHNVHINKNTVLPPFVNQNSDIFLNIHSVGRILDEHLGNKYVAVSQTGYNVTFMFGNSPYPAPSSPLSIDVTLRALNQSYLLLDTNAKWVKEQGRWLQHEERVPNGRYYELSSAFDRVMFHSIAPRAVFVDPTLSSSSSSLSSSSSSSSLVARKLLTKEEN